ncbi:MAG TPA: cytochrome C oxidase subunit IV family protein [Rhabdochlamydiaceae bacterium]|nr:cytochrome C oxidase subunit IV family protein [Rhabdochlamydiaceae bacterium]
MYQKAILLRGCGFFLSLLLTLAAFFIVIRPDFFNMGVKATIIVLFILAVLQFIVQSLFFINLWQEKGPRWNLVIFASTISIIVIVIAGSIWIMNHLNYNMSM